jgi:hypothetical protein
MLILRSVARRRRNPVILAAAAMATIRYISTLGSNIVSKPRRVALMLSKTHVEGRI